MRYTYDINNIDWDELSHLYKIAPLGDKKPQDLKTAFENSMYKCFIYDGDKLIGAGRAVADGIDVSYICDLAIDPKYQAQGLGKKIMEKLMEFSKGYSKIILFASVGKEDFYKKLGFSKMNTAMAIFKNQDKVREIGLIE